MKSFSLIVSNNILYCLHIVRLYSDFFVYFGTLRHFNVTKELDSSVFVSFKNHMNKEMVDDENAIGPHRDMVCMDLYVMFKIFIM